ncbi:hypothetical protein [Parafrankia sp. EUN1f]|uniref:hypothetical protein n=1 Tax=Parafrankia sp. EUN1f TaxID=102897 RepID=UPI0001C45E83|nr:hypothetical protein [Parafrankia sp. EUN1f]EFC82715.1 hypothetical protein FrEUN1fDRAFT_4139 [Parafrankia sp. EUN1f]
MRDVLSATVQGLLVLSLARLCDVTDVHGQVRLLAHTVLDEKLPAGWVPPDAVPPQPSAGEVPGPGASSIPGARSALDADPAPDADPAQDADSAQDAGSALNIDGTEEERAQWLRLVRRVPAGVVTLAREMWAVRRLIDGRAEGRRWHRAVANVPAVGVVGAALGERHAATEISARVYVALGLADELPGI